MKAKDKLDFENRGSDIEIVKASKMNLQACSEILKDSHLGQKYFINSNGSYIGKKLLEEGFENDEIYISRYKNSSSKIVGFSWIQERGIFNWFPFLHVIAVSRQHRGMGYGKFHLEHFDHLCRTSFETDKGFLMVGEYNKKAIELYKRSGYKLIGKVPSLFLKEIDELLFYKDIID